MATKKAVRNGPGKNVSVTTVLPAATLCSGAHNAAELASKMWPGSWTDRFEQYLPVPRGCPPAGDQAFLWAFQVKPGHIYNVTRPPEGIRDNLMVL